MNHEPDLPVGVIGTDGRTDRDFSRARHRAVFHRLHRRLSAWLRRCCSAGRGIPRFAACFAEERTVAGRRERVSLGSMEVELSTIVGSVGRCREFDPDFLPIERSLRTRWKSVERALIEGKFLPPVKLYKIGDRYFVEDGNHRVSTAR
ncbi:MAG: hypothetical protein H0V83_15615 [Rubrobacter sp.]|nr:hypothetical protein [Rubrobacter sp.]